MHFTRSLLVNLAALASMAVAAAMISGCGASSALPTSTLSASNSAAVNATNSSASSGTSSTTTPAPTPTAPTTPTTPTTPAPSPSPTPSPAPSPTPTPAPAPPSPPAPSAMNGIPRSSHVVLVIEENHMFTEVYPNGMPWLVAQGNKYGYTTNYHADTAGSAMDYLWLSSGSCHSQDSCGPLPGGTNDFQCTGDGCFDAVSGAQVPITDDNIFRELGRAGVTWKVYAQSLPNVGYMGYFSGEYVARHNPAVWYSDVLDSAALQQNIVPFTQFATDLAANQLPNYSIIIPDLNNDAHDGTLAQADQFLSDGVSPLLNAPPFKAGGDGMLIVTFDECDAAIGACPEQVYTAVIGPQVIPGTVSASLYRHESTLRTIMDALGVGVYPGASSTAKDMTDFFPQR